MDVHSLHWKVNFSNSHVTGLTSSEIDHITTKANVGFFLETLHCSGNHTSAPPQEPQAVRNKRKNSFRVCLLVDLIIGDSTDLHNVRICILSVLIILSHTVDFTMSHAVQFIFSFRVCLLVDLVTHSGHAVQ